MKYRRTKLSQSFLITLYYYFMSWQSPPPQWAMASPFTRFLDHTRHTKLCRTPLHEWSARRRDLYLPTHNIYNRQTSMATVPAAERPQIHALDRADTGIGVLHTHWDKIDLFRFNAKGSQRNFRCKVIVTVTTTDLPKPLFPVLRN